MGFDGDEPEVLRPSRPGAGRLGGREGGRGWYETDRIFLDSKDTPPNLKQSSILLPRSFAPEYSCGQPRALALLDPAIEAPEVLLFARTDSRTTAIRLSLLLLPDPPRSRRLPRWPPRNNGNNARVVLFSPSQSASTSHSPLVFLPYNTQILLSMQHSTSKVSRAGGREGPGAAWCWTKTKGGGGWNAYLWTSGGRR